MPDWVKGDVIDSRKHVYEHLGYRKHGKRNVCPYQFLLCKVIQTSHQHLSLNITRQLSALSLPPFQGMTPRLVLLIT